GQRNFQAISGPIHGHFGPAIWSEFCSWQAARDSINNGFRACWPLLARLCAHSENPTRQEIIPFRTSAWIARKEGKLIARWIAAGVFRLAGWPRSCPRLQ